MSYEIRMTNGDIAEAETLDALLACAWTLANDDPHEVSLPFTVEVDGTESEWATMAAMVHVREKTEEALR